VLAPAAGALVLFLHEQHISLADSDFRMSIPGSVQSKKEEKLGRPMTLRSRVMRRYAAWSAPRLYLGSG